MYLNKLSVSRFRSCLDTELTFQPDLTVLVGENNGGKSNIIDAIRLITTPLNGRRDRYCEDDDLRVGASPSNFEIQSEFAGLSPTQKGLLISAVPDPTQDRAQFGLRFEPAGGSNRRGKTRIWAGQHADGGEPESGSTDLIRHVYLPALRDARQALGSGGATRIMALFRHFLASDDEERSLLDHAQRGAEGHDVLDRMNTEIETALSELTSGVRKQSAKVNFATTTLLDVARDLRFKLGDAGIDLADIGSSGLGYANLLYIATVAVELARARDADLTLFLVEEPEAHLHPQLQMLVLEFLLEQARKSREQEAQAGHPEGRVQVVVTTHSPNLTAWVPPKHLVVVRSVNVAAGENSPAFAHTRCVPVAALGLSESSLGKINRYLDVSRSALLFGNRAMLVEGIAEALLLPLIARKFVLQEQRPAFLRFKGAVLVAIDGVDFKPYLEALLTPNGDARVADRVVVLTDADPQLEGNRKEELEQFAAGLGAADHLSVYTNQRTLEHELFQAGNEALLKRAFLTVRPRSEQQWNEVVANAPAATRADAFVKFLSDRTVRKGDFAQAVASVCEAGDLALAVPAYIRDAILRISAP